MNVQDVKNHFNCLEAFEDIYSSGSSEVLPFVDRLYYHYDFLKKQKDVLQDSHYPKVSSLLDLMFNKIIEKYVTGNKNIHQFSIDRQFENFGMEEWNRLMSILTPMIRILNLLPLEEYMSMAIDKNEIIIKSFLKFDQEKIEGLRLDIYKQMRLIFANQSILTYELSPLKSELYHQITLKIDLSHNVDQFFCLNIGEENDILLGFSSIFFKYKSSIEHLDKIGAHHCIEIDKNLNIEKFSYGDEEKKRFVNKEIIHFDFLFRPISIIIPNVGQRLSFQELMNQKVNIVPLNMDQTGSEGVSDSIQKQFKFNKNKTFCYVDFFKIIS